MHVLQLKAKARKELEALPKKDQKRMMQAFDELQTQPYAGKKLYGEYEGARSFRVWPYRILYIIYDERVTILVLRIRHRKDVYKTL